MTISTEGRRKFKKAEVAWVARMIEEVPSKALAIMDSTYRKALVDKVVQGDPASMTWCVKFYEYQGRGRIGVRLEREAVDLKGVLNAPAAGFPSGAAFARYYYREA